MRKKKKTRLLNLTCVPQLETQALLLPLLYSSHHGGNGLDFLYSTPSWAAQVASWSLRNKHTGRRLKCPTIFFLPNVTSSFPVGREDVFIGQLYSTWTNPAYER